MDLKNRVIKELNKKLNELRHNTSEFLDVRINDLFEVICMIEDYDFIKMDKLIIDEMLLIETNGKYTNGKVFYTNELLNYDIDVITVKIIAEILAYEMGILNSHKLKLYSEIYFALIHLSLITVNIPKNHDGLYIHLLQKESQIIDKYDLNFSNYKKEYYLNYTLKNFKDKITPYIIAKEYKFNNGIVLVYNAFKGYITNVFGINIRNDLKFGIFKDNYEILKNQIGKMNDFEEYEKCCEELKTSNSVKYFNRIYVNHDYTPIINPRTKRQLKEQFDLINVL